MTILSDYAIKQTKSAALAVMLSSAAMSADRSNKAVTNDEVVAYLHNQVVTQSAKTNQVIESCYAVRDTTKIDVTAEQVREHFKSAGLTSEDAFRMIGYIGLRNSDLCSRATRAEPLVNVIALEKYLTKIGKSFRVIMDDGEELTYTELWDCALLPSEMNYTYAVQYEQLSAETKAYIKSHFGTTPFAFMPFTEALQKE